ncbi:MAG: ATP-binding protein [Chloroflexi bacterium]|nr:MAG: ATP-binding protein [Chloroflexota bacterium]
MVKSLYTRFLADRVSAALDDTPVVAVVGARQAGKSTLVREQVALPSRAVYVTFDDPVPLAAARADPDGFIDSYDVPLVLDEAQRVPEIFRAIKRAVDRHRRPGRYLLTGSADVLHLPRVSESLAGRMEVLTLWPLSQGELAGRRETFVDRVFSEGLPVAEVHESLAHLVGRVVRGGFPDAVTRDAERRSAWFESYAATVLQREVSEIAAIERAHELPRLLRVMAGRSGTALNLAEISRATGIQHSTLTRYVTLLELAYLVRRIPAWTGSASRRLIRHPKIVMSDSGLAAHLVGADTAGIASDSRERGALIEAFVAMELVKQSGWAKSRVAIHHYRSAPGTEVDIVIERADRRLVGIEVKTAATIDSRDANGLRSLADATGSRFHRGLVLYLGRETVPLGRAIHALPIPALWSGA